MGGGVTLFTFCAMFIVLMAGCPMPDAPPTMFAPALVAGDGQLTASWAELAAIWNEVNKKDGNAITAYNLRYGEFGSESWTEINTGITTSHTITELTNGMNYAVQVRAVNAGGAGSWSASATATPIAPPTAPPAAPGTMAAPTLEVENGQLIAKWTAPEDNGGSPITGYELQYRTDDDGDWTIIISGSITCARSEGQTEVCQFAFSFYPSYTGHTIAGTTDVTNYRLQVRAVNAQGNGEWSATAMLSFATQVPAGTPAVAILPAEINAIIAAENLKNLSLFVTTVGASNITVVDGDITAVTSVATPDGVTIPTVDASSGLITLTVAADTTAGTYLVYGSDTGTGDIVFAEYFYITLSPTTNAELQTAVDAGISDWGQTGNFNYIITAAVRDMSSIFYNKPEFNGDISLWDVSKVTNMYRILSAVPEFNGDISLWDVSKVTNMNQMFNSAEKFNGDISAWDVSSVTNMSNMFSFTDSFNGNISAWDVSKVTHMNYMFGFADSFNGDISAWDVSSVTNMTDMFYFASAFSQNLEEWKDHWTLDSAGKYTGDKTNMFLSSGVTTPPSWY